MHNGEVCDFRFEDDAIIFDVVPGNNYQLVFATKKSIWWSIGLVAGAILLIVLAIIKRMRG